MRQFKPYPIYINHSHWQNVGERQADEFYARGDVKMGNWMKSTGKRLLEITEDTNPSPESIAYEEAVVEQLKIIGKTAVGKLLLAALNPQVKHWIIPGDESLYQSCGCAALTASWVLTDKQGGGVRLYFDPFGFDPKMEYYTPDDILFHEMIHAYRGGRVGYSGQNNKPLREYLTAEELLAIHLQNVYLACRGHLQFYLTHRNPRLATKNETYYHLATDIEALGAMEYFLRNEPLAAKVATWAYPLFNPWRDYADLEAILFNRYPIVNGKVRPIPLPW
jgi:hypothetical protein